ncbi:ComB2 competence protein [Helicobacter sp. NHP19-012]|uniref:ComB2 competence protein n=1 Tax=Helicobacter gastrofelis TaxID=2849642 RepID=A0ABM7SIW8_9HELI|nr:TrbC/VirB2 family protein [Helicobacter sp. NHP19-012]BCZ19898.1 ComB2 competence protein [Helicobacter sp. NHP19-012]
MRWLWIFLALDFLQADGGDNFFKAIEAQLQSNTAKGILMLIFIGIAFYVWRNLDRWRDILFTILGVVLGIMLFFKAPALASWFMGLF